MSSPGIGWFDARFKSSEFPRSAVQCSLATNINDVVQDMSGSLMSPVLSELTHHPNVLEKTKILFDHLDAQSGNRNLINAFGRAVLKHGGIDHMLNETIQFIAPDVDLDLAINTFNPCRRAIPHNPGQPESIPLSRDELDMAAFYPPAIGTTIRILHPQLPFPPIEIPLPNVNPAQAPGSGPNAPVTVTVTLRDVLGAVHRTLQASITRDDWATLHPAQQQAVEAAFDARCRAEAARSLSGAPTHALAVTDGVALRSVREQGVKKVDFLLGKTVLRGLVPGQPDGVFRLVTV
ncbi:hypothetical protein C8F01DRAFT_1034892 [Mycena amicta]|nr:hypothetical protein C8F01DRAFT_1034892 [Mycena amicta]